MRRVMKMLGWTLLVLLAAAAAFTAWNWEGIQRIFLGGVRVYERRPPAIPAHLPHPAILVFSKTNGFRHEEAIPAANALFARMARANGWGMVQTENGAAFTPAVLQRFDAVVFNNVSGDVFTPEQRGALRRFIEHGGGFVGVHASGGDFRYRWRWYAEHLIGAQFTGHPGKPQFQKAVVRIEDRDHPATRNLPAAWSRTDEWYSFERPPRRPGFHVLAAIDERTYDPSMIFDKDIAMGSDHPVMWWHCVGKGRVFYSALGHTAASYREPLYSGALEDAVRWALAGKASARSLYRQPECGNL
jgi:type 1 glutamine amidotransferase